MEEQLISANPTYSPVNLHDGITPEAIAERFTVTLDGSSIHINGSAASRGSNYVSRASAASQNILTGDNGRLGVGRVLVTGVDNSPTREAAISGYRVTDNLVKHLWQTVETLPPKEGDKDAKPTTAKRFTWPVLSKESFKALAIEGRVQQRDVSSFTTVAMGIDDQRQFKGLVSHQGDNCLMVIDRDFKRVKFIVPAAYYSVGPPGAEKFEPYLQTDVFDLVADANKMQRDAHLKQEARLREDDVILIMSPGFWKMLPGVQYDKVPNKERLYQARPLISVELSGKTVEDLAFHLLQLGLRCQVLREKLFAHIDFYQSYADFKAAIPDDQTLGAYLTTLSAQDQALAQEVKDVVYGHQYYNHLTKKREVYGDETPMLAFAVYFRPEEPAYFECSLTASRVPCLQLEYLKRFSKGINDPSTKYSPLLVRRVGDASKRNERFDRIARMSVPQQFRLPSDRNTQTLINDARSLAIAKSLSQLYANVDNCFFSNGVHEGDLVKCFNSNVLLLYVPRDALRDELRVCVKDLPLPYIFQVVNFLKRNTKFVADFPGCIAKIQERVVSSVERMAKVNGNYAQKIGMLVCALQQPWIKEQRHLEFVRQTKPREQRLLGQIEGALRTCQSNHYVLPENLKTPLEELGLLQRMSIQFK